jgi:hypothetical protein
VNRDTKKRRQAYTALDFFPSLCEAEQDTAPGPIDDPNELLAHIMAWGAAGNSTMRIMEQ